MNKIKIDKIFTNDILKKLVNIENTNKLKIDDYVEHRTFCEKLNIFEEYGLNSEVVVLSQLFKNKENYILKNVIEKLKDIGDENI
jgi:hypothetical protein